MPSLAHAGDLARETEQPRYRSFFRKRPDMLSINFPLFFRQLGQSIFRSRGTHYRLTAHRAKWLLIIVVMFFISVSYHWFFFFLDAVFFPRFRRQKVSKPLFIIGNFRTGSTLLHRIMAQDTENFVSFKTWEIYLAPSISQRKFFRTILLIDSLLGKPLQRTVTAAEKKMFDSNRLHKMALREPEEEEGLLIFIWNSFWLHYFFPIPEYFAPYEYFDSLIPAPKRRRIMRFYMRAVQRHLYAHDGGKALLSKNPGFTPKVRSLIETFPDARFIYLVRDPVDTATSKISWFAFWYNLFNSPQEPYPLKDETIEMMKLWYTYPLEVLKTLPRGRALVINYDDFIKNPTATVRRIYRTLGYRLNRRFARILDEETSRARGFKSSRETTAESIGLSKKILHHRFEIYRYFRMAKR
jgi:hypothetical protein